MSTSRVTIDTCAQEPIHIPGAIQAHGVLFACRGDDLRIAQVSANVTRYLGVEADALLSRPISEVIATDDAARLTLLCQQPNLREANPVAVRSRNGARFDAVLHRPKDRERVVIVELEPQTSAGDEGATFDPRLRTSVLRLQGARDVATLCRVAAQEVRAITGFDRTMVYRFDADWNGEVVAEDRREDLEPFLGLHYPASDIPAQARLLYASNWLRFIPDVNYTPAPLVRPVDPDDGVPLDLSHAVLRSVSPIHIEYLRNMRVTASMSISLMIEGRLAGLIACHHYSGPREIPYRIRDTAEYLGHTLSWQLAILETADRAERAFRAKQVEAALVRGLLDRGELPDGLDSPALLKLTDAAGAAIVVQEATRTLGSAPDAAVLARIVEWLRAQRHDVFATDALAEHMAEASAWTDVAAGLVAVAIARDLGEYVLWFRPSQERTVDWGGDPRKAVVASDDGNALRLSPRGSFALWREIVRGRSAPWDPLNVEAASDLRRILLGGVRKRAAELKAMNQRLIDTDRAKDAFIATVSHELRTPLNAITGWTHLLQSGAIRPEQVPQALEVIARNARAQTQIIEDLLDVARMTSGKMKLDIESVDLVPIVESVLDSAALSVEAKGLRVKRMFDPDATPVLGDAARLRQVVSNLVTNAVKFTPKGGSITVVLRRLRSDVEIAVSDTGQGIAPDTLPHIFETFWQADPGMNRRSQGLGLGLAIVRKLVELHGGRIEAESEGEGRGATFRVRLPLAPVASSSADDAHQDRPHPAPALHGMRVLVVEDEPDARDLLRVLFTQCGAEVYEAESAAQALALQLQHAFDLVVSDIGLPGQDGLALLRAWREREGSSRRTPAIALTAYTRAVDRTRALQAGFSAHVQKPVDTTELVTVAASLVGRL